MINSFSFYLFAKENNLEIKCNLFFNFNINGMNIPLFGSIICRFIDEKMNF